MKAINLELDLSRKKQDPINYQYEERKREHYYVSMDYKIIIMKYYKHF